jgi:hypothetical protein
MLVGLALIAAAMMDVLLGFLVVLPRAREETRGALRAAFVGGSIVILGLGVAFILGVVPGMDN